jgi:hypothetical protein
MAKLQKKSTKESKDIDVYLKKLGNRLKQLRIKKGYTNYEYFAYEHNIGRAQYGKYETGSNIQFDTLVKLIKCHKMTVKEFFSEGFD